MLFRKPWRFITVSRSKHGISRNAPSFHHVPLRQPQFACIAHCPSAVRSMLSQLFHKFNTGDGVEKEQDTIGPLPARPLPSFQTSNPFPCLTCAPGAPKPPTSDEEDEALTAEVKNFRVGSYVATGGDLYVRGPAP